MSPSRTQRRADDAAGWCKGFRVARRYLREQHADAVSLGFGRCNVMLGLQHTSDVLLFLLPHLCWELVFQP